ncbi:MAG: AMP-binding protein [Deltaproteobacteria bacterium]|nr:AMP-binding protein [Deltaproteobacteria bacterium]
MLRGRTYQELLRNFAWKIPERYNIGVDVCDKWSRDPHRLALIHLTEDGVERRYTFNELKRLSNRLANTLRAHGIERGDRVGILLSQKPETLLTHIALYKLGAIALPLVPLFGPMAIEYRLNDSQAKGLITDRENLPKISEIKDRLHTLEMVMVTDPVPKQEALDFWEVIKKGSDRFVPVNTSPDDPALIIYTSGTTGQPKGTLHAHRLLPGILPGFEYFHNLFPKPGDLLYTPLDWAYIGGSYDSLFPALHHGIPVVAYRPPKFDPERVFYIMEKYGVRNFMAVPTVLRMMMQAVKNPQDHYKLRLRSVTAGGETLGGDLYNWSQTALNVQLNEQYGQTECDLTLGFCSEVMPVAQGAVGKPVPGHVVDIIDESGRILPPGELGEIAVKRPDPVMFLKYWNNPEATRKKFAGDWLKTGDYAQKDDQGHFWFSGRRDDLIESGGFRIGPGEIEDCLMSHKDIALVCVVGVPDKVRGEIVKAFIVPAKGVAPNDVLKNQIQDYVKKKLEAHAWPRKITFLKEMPMTKTGKIRKEILKKMD